MRALQLLACVCLVSGGLAVAAGDAAAKHPAKHPTTHRTTHRTTHGSTQSPSVDCNAHNYKLTRQYSIAALQHALATMPAQIKEYTPCYQVVQQQLNAQLASSGTTTTPPTGTTAKPKSSGSSLSGVLIAVVVVIVLLGGGMAYWASRRNAGGDGDGDGDGSDGDQGSRPPGTDA